MFASMRGTADKVKPLDVKIERLFCGASLDVGALQISILSV